MVPATPAMPLVITVKSCGGVRPARYGRITSGDSDWPTKMFAAAQSDSTLEVPITFSIAPPTQRTTSCMTPR